MPTFDINIVGDNNLITPVSDTKLLDIYLQDLLNCHNHYSTLSLNYDQHAI